MIDPAVEATGVRSDLPRLTSLRAFAALAVFGYHCGLYLNWTFGRRAFGTGYAGVSFFFILSGFVLAWSTPEGRSPLNFYRRRFARVYPMHLLTALVGLVLFGAASAWAVVSNVLLIQAWDPRDQVHYSLNGLSWSLSCEAFFYLVCPLALILARTRGRAFAAITVSSVAVSGIVTTALVLHSDRIETGIYTNPAARVGEFFIGICLAVALRRGRACTLPFSAAVIFTLLTVEVVRLAFAQYYPASDFVFIPAFSLLIWSAASHDSVARQGWFLTNPVLVYAGKVSFCFYLVHEMVLKEMQKHHVSAVAGAAVSLMVATALAVLSYQVIEHPLELRLRPKART